MLYEEAYSRVKDYLTYLEGLGSKADEDEVKDIEALRLVLSAADKGSKQPDFIVDSKTNETHEEFHPRFATCTFVKRISRTLVEIAITYYGGVIHGVVDRNSTCHVNFKPYTDDEWDALDFENMKNCLCAGARYKNSNKMMTFDCRMPEK